MADGNGRPAYVAIARKAFNDPLWLEKRVFSRWEAWVDLIQLAQWKPQDWVVGPGASIQLARGETRPLSRSFLADRWGYSERTAYGYLQVLQRMDRIRAGQRTAQGTTYVLINYEFYNGDGTGQRTGEGQAAVQAEGQVSGQATVQQTDRQPYIKRNIEPSNHESSKDSVEVGELPLDDRKGTNGGRRNGNSHPNLAGALPASRRADTPRSWSTLAVDTWRQFAGEPDVGPLVKALKPVYDQLLDARKLCYGLAAFLVSGNAKFGPHVFARDWRKWVPDGRQGLPTATDLAIGAFLDGERRKEATA